MTRPKWPALFLIGGGAYVLIEYLWRGHSHPAMFLLGGLLFLLLGSLNEGLPWEMPLVLQGLVGAALVTLAELVAGVVLNNLLGLHIWDYSAMPGNILGQICPQFAAAWYGLSLVAIVLDDWLRYWLWHEDKPRYTLFRWKGVDR